MLWRTTAKRAEANWWICELHLNKNLIFSFLKSLQALYLSFKERGNADENSGQMPEMHTLNTTHHSLACESIHWKVTPYILCQEPARNMSENSSTCKGISMFPCHVEKALTGRYSFTPQGVNWRKVQTGIIMFHYQNVYYPETYLQLCIDSIYPLSIRIWRSCYDRDCEYN